MYTTEFLITIERVHVGKKTFRVIGLPKRIYSSSNKKTRTALQDRDCIKRPRSIEDVISEKKISISTVDFTRTSENTAKLIGRKYSVEGKSVIEKIMNKPKPYFILSCSGGLMKIKK